MASSSDLRLTPSPVFAHQQVHTKNTTEISKTELDATMMMIVRGSNGTGGMEGGS